MTTDLATRLDPRHTAVVVVDVQNDFCHPEGALGQRGGDMTALQQAPRRISSVVEAAHRVGVPVIFIRMNNSDWTVDEPTREVPSSIKPGFAAAICWEGSWGAEFYHLTPGPLDRVVTKYRYSAFLYTELELILRCKNIQTLVVTGVVTNTCVHTTVRDGYMRGFHMVVPEDCCATLVPEDHQNALKDMSEKLATITSSEVVRALWLGSADQGKAS